MMVKSGLEFIFKFTEPLKRYLPGQFGHCGQTFLHWAAATLKGLGKFQIKKSRPLFTIIFKLKNGNFITRDFSPLIKRVLAGVTHTAPFDSAKPYQKFVLSVKWQRGSLSNIIKVHFTPLHTKR